MGEHQVIKKLTDLSQEIVIKIKIFFNHKNIDSFDSIFINLSAELNSVSRDTVVGYKKNA